MDMNKKTRDMHIVTTVERYNLIKALADKDRRKVTAIIELALDQYLNSRKTK